MGDPITFRVTDITPGFYGEIDVIFKSTDIPQKFSDVTVRLNLSGEYYPSKHKGWAGSNIYWKNGELTFDDVDIHDNEKYQGVYFKWGSLTGISPVGDYAKTTILYEPGKTSGTQPNIAWGSILHVQTDASITFKLPAGKSGQDRAYLYELDTKDGKGDICKYLTEKTGGTLYGKKWRMPTSREFDSRSNYTESYSYYLSTFASNEVNGTYSINAGYKKKTDIGTPSFPTSGARRTSDGFLMTVGTYGYYWSSSPLGSTSGYGLSFFRSLPGSNDLQTSSNYTRSAGLAVRCVVDRDHFVLPDSASENA